MTSFSKEGKNLTPSNTIRFYQINKGCQYKINKEYQWSNSYINHTKLGDEPTPNHMRWSVYAYCPNPLNPIWTQIEMDFGLRLMSI